ncbi:helix-turn-helix transcriptional regulator [Natrinema thermotolerans]|uniref:Helix-turn-helix transcriptional regulator n=1 Tax=Natrinema thermotolerans TaxID=121872 RepID=A0AAF0PCE8_9EURY|nr:helix-turn-helix transcriptional regulator [Natrinema thermotolerans]QCC58382.1 ArsR family transcriptional regulator [Natrinema thermotolerans]WMT09503.1 helix-turn-helix transcriptional regulator [Natrinema thermotolerans]
MRPLVSWMTKSDPAILEVFEEAGIAIPPAVAEYNLVGISKSTVKRRLPVLVDHGLLEKVDDDRGYYRITDRGRAYLEGELDAEDLEPSED